jgi:hypothetical protein
MMSEDREVEIQRSVCFEGPNVIAELMIQGPVISHLFGRSGNGVFCRVDFASGHWCEYQQDHADSSLYILMGSGVDLVVDRRQRLVVSDRETNSQSSEALPEMNEHVPLEGGRGMSGAEVEAWLESSNNGQSD